MPNIKAMSDLNELDKVRALECLFATLEEGEASAREQGWIPAEQVEAELGVNIEEN
jgi:hypothetical protein